MFNLKKLLRTSALVALLLMGCGNNEEANADESAVAEEPLAKEVEAEQKTKDEIAETEEATDTMIGALADVESIPIEEYDGDKCFSADLSDIVRQNIENEVFVEDDAIYIGNDTRYLMRLSPDFSPVWEKENQYGFTVSLASDGRVIYNHNQGSRGRENYVEVLDKETCEPLYQIDTSNYDEMSEVTFDNDALYLAFGYITNPDEDIYADDYTLFAFDKTDGSELWSLDIDASRLGSGRAQHYNTTTLPKVMI